MSKGRLRFWLGAFLIALAVPTAVLVRQTYTQLKWEAFYQYRLLAEELAVRIDARLVELVETQENRGFADYGFLVVAGDPAASFVQRSPLSAYPVNSAIPGLLGYFQVGAKGEFSTPLLPRDGAEPTAYGLSADELRQRRELATRLQRILRPAPLAKTQDQPERAGLTAASPAPGAAPEAGREPATSMEAPGATEARRKSADFSRGLESSLGLGARLDAPRDVLTEQIRVDELELDDRYQAESNTSEPALKAITGSFRSDTRVSRKERSVLPEQQSLMPAEETKAPAKRERSDVRIDVFESEIDPFELILFDDQHFILYRKVWRDESRFIQGAIIELEAFLQGVVEEAFRPTALSRMSDLVVAYKGNVLTALTEQSQRGELYGAEDLRGSLLYRTRLSSPLSDLELIFTLTRLPSGPGAAVVNWMTVLFALVLAGGTYLMYRLGVQQIGLARQQQDFVSAVSHELKTPLTSIRMYAEMLREGWASEDKKLSYYNYIHEESERLSRLIGNVLELARLTRNDLQIDLQTISVTELMDSIHAKTAAQAERAGFNLALDYSAETGGASIRLDPDCFSQIFINLADNAIKFSARAEHKKIEIGCRLLQDGQALFSVRDYGPGIPQAQMKKIFRLFYRSENELTRETVGTGIGLALVHQLAKRMGGHVDVLNRDPGTEFQVCFPTAPPG